ncbi:MAG TPA: DUF5777 family beta-barrel protein [Bacteroidia bacterium]|nr:DUF5777 family beta-barrel protein [Bacteroidia bacterium]
MKKNIPAILFFLLLSSSLFAQDDLLKQLQAEAPAPKKEAVLATFKGNKIINVQTNETVKKNNLDIRINHLFGSIGKESGGTFHNLYGFDQSQDIRIGAHYGITDRLMTGFSRSKRQENLELLLKFKLLEQTTNQKVPIGITLYGNTTYSTKDDILIEKDVHRLTYFGQIIFTRKFSPKFSLDVAGGFLHRNYVLYNDESDVMNVSGGFRWKFTPSASFIADYSHTFGRDAFKKNVDVYDVAGAGIEIETGGHVFSIMFTNASGILENDFMVNTEDSWSKGGMKFSFIISRMFKF